MRKVICAALLSVIAIQGCISEQNAVSDESLRVIFGDDGEAGFSSDERREIEKTIVESERKVRSLLPNLPGEIEVKVVIIGRNTDIVGGVTGQAYAPGKVQIEISSVYPGGILAATRKSLASSIFHEFHHLARGWTIEGNRYGPGIPIAAVNEGLADIFTEEFTGVYFTEANSYPENADEWLSEILSLPLDADYGTWMFQHPDGRTSIGYRVGRYIVHQAMANSGKGVLELGTLSPEAILDLAQAPFEQDRWSSQ